MFYKIVCGTCMCLLLLVAASCSAPEPVTSENAVQTEAPELMQDQGKTSGPDEPEALIRLGNKKLTMEHINWLQPNANSHRIRKIVEWWLESELLYAEAQKRGLTEEARAKFFADIMTKRAVAQELTKRVREDVKISDEAVLNYYEENKETDPRLKQPGLLSFTHIQTRTLEQAQSAIEALKAGQNPEALAKKLSIDRDGKKGGVVNSNTYRVVERRFGREFFDAAKEANVNDLIGPVNAKKEGYEVARLKSKTEPKFKPFEQAKEVILTTLERNEKQKVIDLLLKSLKEAAADQIVRSPRLTQTDEPVTRPLTIPKPKAGEGK